MFFPDVYMITGLMDAYMALDLAVVRLEPFFDALRKHILYNTAHSLTACRYV